MQSHESATAFVKRVFQEVICDLSPRSFDAIPRYFHPSFVQEVDQRVLNRDGFTELMRQHKPMMATPPVFTWKKLVATEPDDGRIHVTSVHHVSAMVRLATRCACGCSPCPPKVLTTSFAAPFAPSLFGTAAQR
jgi:hypothetical protein